MSIEELQTNLENHFAGGHVWNRYASGLTEATKTRGRRQASLDMTLRKNVQTDTIKGESAKVSQVVEEPKASKKPSKSQESL